MHWTNGHDIDMPRLVYMGFGSDSISIVFAAGISYLTVFLINKKCNVNGSFVYDYIHTKLTVICFAICTLFCCNQHKMPLYVLTVFYFELIEHVSSNTPTVLISLL